MLLGQLVLKRGKYHASFRGILKLKRILLTDHGYEEATKLPYKTVEREILNCW